MHNIRMGGAVLACLLGLAMMAPATTFAAPAKHGHFAGTVQSDNGSQLVIKSRNGNTDTFTLESTTKCFGAGHATIGCGSYTSGQRVLVEAAQSAGSWIAKRVSLQRSATHPKHRLFDGVVQSDNGSQLVIKDRKGNTDTFGLSSSTKCFGAKHASVGCGSYTTGQKVLVEAEQSSGAWVADRVSLQGAAKHPKHRLFAGAVQSDNGTQLVIKDRKGNTDTFGLSSSTKCFGAKHASVGCGSYTTGQKVLVEAEQSSGAWVADRVSLQGAAKHPKHRLFAGAVQSDNGTQLVIKDRKGTTDTFGLSSSTKCFGAKHASVGCGSYTTGQRVQVEATKQAGGSWVADRVSLAQRHHHR